MHLLSAILTSWFCVLFTLQGMNTKNQAYLVHFFCSYTTFLLTHLDSLVQNAKYKQNSIFKAKHSANALLSQTKQITAQAQRKR